MMPRKTFVLLTIFLLLTAITHPARAGLELVKQSTKTVGVTTVTWDSSFRDLDYTVGEPITMTVPWTVDVVRQPSMILI